jgi:hypothetical protein
MRTVLVSVTTSATSTKPKLSDPEGTSLSQAATGATRARSTLTSPPPMRVMDASAPVNGLLMISVSPLFINSAFSSTGFRPCPKAKPGGVPLGVVLARPKPSISKAAEPVTIGAAPEVPPKGPSPVPVPAMADTDAPGAPISGLIRVVSSCCGPREELPTTVPTSGTPTAGSKRTTVFGKPLFSRLETVWLII